MLRAMVKAVASAASTMRSIRNAHDLSPHRWRQFELSNDPEFAKKLHDMVMRIDSCYFRPTEVETLLGDPSKT